MRRLLTMYRQVVQSGRPLAKRSVDGRLPRTPDSRFGRQLLFPTEDAARKLLYLAIVNAQQTWRRTYNCNAALAAFKIHFGERLPDTAV